MTPQEAKILLKKYLDGTCTDDERALVESWHIAELKRAQQMPSSAKLAETHRAMRRTVLAHAAKQEKIRRLRSWLPYAAAVLIVLAVGFWVVGDRALVADDQSNLTSKIVNLKSVDIAPGGNRAKLTLADGRVVDLSEGQAGIIVGDGIKYLDGSKISAMGYETPDMRTDSASESHVKSQISNLMSLSTPKGGTYSITLADGTKVWLNAVSTLKYPSAFTGDERVVELEGEGYFAVAKDVRRPFKVITDGQEVDVLGTEFNISAYADEPEIKTTLVEGSVKVSNLKSQVSNLLKPGTQSIIGGAVTDIRNVDVQQYTAWKDGLFYFDGIAPEAAFAQLERWYDIEVIYEGEIPTIRFFGMLDRTDHLNAALAILKESGLEFKLTKSGGTNRLIVMGE